MSAVKNAVVNKPAVVESKKEDAKVEEVQEVKQKRKDKPGFQSHMSMLDQLNLMCDRIMADPNLSKDTHLVRMANAYRKTQMHRMKPWAKVTTTFSEE